MIDFSKIENKNYMYELLYAYTMTVHDKIYYKHFVVRGLENLPPNGEPYMIISNHQNSLNDAMAVVSGLKKQRPVFIARGDIFKKPLVAKMLRFIRVLPAFRVRDAGKENLGENALIFNRSAEILGKGGIIAMFPEAMHQNNRYLGTFKKGFSRIAFLAEEKADFNLNLKIVPVANHYSNYYSIGNDLLLNIGKPFEFKEFYEIYKEHPEKAYHLLALKSREKVRDLMLDIQDQEHYDQYDNLRDLYYDTYLKRNNLKKSYFPNKLDADRDIVQKLDNLKESDNTKFVELMEKTLSYLNNVKSLSFRNWIIGKKYSLAGLLLKSLAALCWFPFYLILFILNAVPYYIDTPLVKKVKDKLMHASLHMGIGILVTIPIWTLLLFGLSFIIPWPWWCSFLLLPILPMTLVLYNRSKVAYLKLRHQWRYFVLKKNKNLKLLETETLKSELIKEIATI